MSPARVDDADPVRRHLATVLAVMARVTSDPALAFDIATEALARGLRFAREEATATSGEMASARSVLEAAEHVFRASVQNGRVPQVERLRTGHASPTELSEQLLFEIRGLGRESLAEHPEAEALLRILQRDAPALRELATVARSTLVRTQSTAHRQPDGGADR